MELVRGSTSDEDEIVFTCPFDIPLMVIDIMREVIDIMREGIDIIRSFKEEE